MFKTGSFIATGILISAFTGAGVRLERIVSLLVAGVAPFSTWAVPGREVGGKVVASAWVKTAANVKCLCSGSINPSDCCITTATKYMNSKLLRDATNRT